VAISLAIMWRSSGNQLAIIWRSWRSMAINGDHGAIRRDQEATLPNPCS